MEQIDNPEAPKPDENRIQQFAEFLGGISTVEELFGDDGLAGDFEPRAPHPAAPPAKAARSYEEYFAPVYQLQPPNPVLAASRQILRLVHSS